jgi:hypothetical protein
MHNLNLNLGTKVVSINGDPDRTIEFNPRDTLFVEKFYQVYSDIQEKQEELTTRAKAIDDTPGDDGLPKGFNEQIALINETCVYMREKIDYLFGEGASQTVFGKVNNLDAIAQFLEGIMPLVMEERSQKVSKYAAKKPTKTME